MNQLEVIGQIADLKDVDYKTNLLLAALIELLAEKGAIEKNELRAKTAAMDFISELEILAQKESPAPRGSE